MVRVGVDVDKLRLQLGIQNRLAGVEALIAGEHIAHAAGDGKIAQFSRTKQLHAQKDRSDRTIYRTAEHGHNADGRAEACEVLSRADFDLLVNDNTAALLRQAAQDAETEQERAEVRELQRAYDQISKIPADEYAAFTKLT